MRRIAVAVTLVALGLAAVGCGSDDNAAGTKATATKTTNTTKTTTTKTTATTKTTTTKSTASSAGTPAIRQVLHRWGHADTAPEACALMSARVKRGLLDHDAAACTSKKKLEALLGVVLKPTDLKVKTVHVAGDKADARVEEPLLDAKRQRTTQLYHLVREGSSWKVDSVEQPDSGTTGSDGPSLPLE